MKRKEIKELSNLELNEKLDEETALLRKLKMNHSVSPLENPLRIRVARKTLAAIKTEKRKRELNEPTEK